MYRMAGVLNIQSFGNRHPGPCTVLGYILTGKAYALLAFLELMVIL